MNVKFADLALLDMIHKDHLEVYRSGLRVPWEELQRTHVGKGLRAYLLVRLLKVNDTLGVETDDAAVHRLQGEAKVLKDILRLMSPTGGAEIGQTICNYVAQFKQEA